MNPNKIPLTEITQDINALQAARSEPIQQKQPRRPMDFIRSLVLDLPVQQEKPNETNQMNIEKILETQLEAEVKKLEKPKDATDHVSFDVPLLIRVFELVREGIKSDVELHDLVERIIAVRDKGVLTMHDYKDIAGGNPSGTEREGDPITSSPFAGDQQSEDISAIKKLAGIR